MNRSQRFRQISMVLAVLGAMMLAPSVDGSGRSKLATEAAEFILQRFGRQAVREGTETLARRIEVGLARHGDDFLHAVKQVGPRAIHLAEEAGVHGNQAVRAMAAHGEHGAAWIVARPKGMQLFLQHGDDAAAALVKHKGIAEPVIEQFGKPAVKAMQATSAQSGRRLAMMTESGELARMGRSDEVLEVVARYGDRAMLFVWEHKGTLAVTACLAAFLGDPEPYLSGAKELALIAGENAIKPITQVPAQVARGVNWTIIFLAAGAAGFLVLLAKLLLLGWFRPKLLPADEKGASINGTPLAARKARAVPSKDPPWTTPTGEK